jgi:predicted MFS family arabinose efflux permease
MVAGGAAALALFVAVERRQGERAIMPLAMFGTGSFVGLTILTFLLYAALGALFVLLPYLLIAGYGYSPVEAGAALLPLPVVLGLASRTMGGVAARVGPRLPLTVGPLVVAGGFLLLSRAGADANYWTGIAPALLVIAVGLSGAVAPLTTAVMASVDDEHVGTANGFNSAVARTGGLIATALLGSVLAAQGEALASAFAAASLVMATAAALSALAALVLLRPVPKPT